MTVFRDVISKQSPGVISALTRTVTQWSLTRIFWCLAGLVVLMALGLAAPALRNVGATLARANATMDRLDRLSAGLTAAQLLSAERGATSSLILAPPADQSTARSGLQSARRLADEALATFEQASAAASAADSEAAAEIRRTRRHVEAVRGAVDQFLVRPSGSRPAAETAALMTRMIGLNAALSGLNLRAATEITRLDHSIADVLRVVLLTAQLREHAGQLGTLTVIQLIRKTPADVATIAEVGHLTGRIDELHGELSATLTSLDPATDLGRAHAALETRVFGKGLTFARHLIETADRPDAVTPQAFKGAYRADLALIDGLRNISFAEARAKIADAHDAALHQYVAAAAVTGIVMTMLGLIGIAIKRYLVAPLAQATEQIRRLAEDRQDGRTPERLGCRELQDIAGALVKLGQSSARRKALEEERRDLLRQLDQLAHSDYLTGLANRRTLDTRLEELFAAPPASSRDLALLMIDIDFFKQFNDSYGHLAGDACIRAVAAILKEEAGTALVARFGGEEFCVLLERDTAEAWGIAERLRRAIQAARLPHAARPDLLGVVTVSIGIAVATPTLTTAAYMLNAADNALYVAKRRGRNETTALEPLRTREAAVAA